MRVQISSLREKAKRKPKGYLRDALAHCHQTGHDECEMSYADFLRLGEKYPAVKPALGLGDVVAIFAKPVARIMDRLFKAKIEGCVPCSKRQTRLNRWRLWF